MIKMVCSGLGGQGVLTLGLILANIAANHGKNITWVPSYGSEMRGGVANCTMKISDDEIISPYMDQLDILVALSPSAMESYEDKVAEHGCVIVNSSIVKDVDEKKNTTFIKIPATDIANSNNNTRGQSLAIIGAVIAYTNMVSKDEAVKGVNSYFANKNIYNDANEKVFLEGYERTTKIIKEA